MKMFMLNFFGSLLLIFCIKTSICLPLRSNSFRVVNSDYLNYKRHHISDRLHNKESDSDYPKQGITNFKRKSLRKKKLLHPKTILDGMKKPISSIDIKLSLLLTVEDLYPHDGKKLEQAGYFEGDMKIHEKLTARNAYRGKQHMWASGIVYYVLDPKLNENKRAMIRKAFQEYEHKTCLKFKQATPKHRSYVYIFEGDGCYSEVGFMGRRQELSLGDGCGFGQTLHELMHTIGFFHEQSRTDRDNYVVINWENIQKGFETQFSKYDHAMIRFLGEKYDYWSIMHYGADFFTNGNGDTIVPLKEGVNQIGQRFGFSKIDVKKINKLYKCKIAIE